MAKYSYIKTLSLEEDNNEYRVGVYGSYISKKCDLLINGKPLFDEIPYNDGKSISVVESGYFIKLSAYGANIVIREGKVVFFTNRYDVVNAYAMIDYNDVGVQFVSDIYLVVVSRKDGPKGVYSTKNFELVLPIKYSTIDIDEHFNIILGEKVNLDEYDEELKNNMLKSMRKGEYMQIGDYSEKHNRVFRKAAEVNCDEVWIEREGGEYYYYWDDDFKVEIEHNDNSHVNVPSDWDDYSHEDSLYDALGGEMDAKWNID